MCVCISEALLYSGNECSIVNQLYFSKKKIKKKQNPSEGRIVLLLYLREKEKGSGQGEKHNPREVKMWQKKIQIST